MSSLSTRLEGLTVSSQLGKVRKNLSAVQGLAINILSKLST